MPGGFVMPAPSSAHLKPGLGNHFDDLTGPKLQVHALEHACQHLVSLFRSGQRPILSKAPEVLDRELNDGCRSRRNWARSASRPTKGVRSATVGPAIGASFRQTTS